MGRAEFNPKILNPNDYTPVGDIIVLALCIVMTVVLFLNRIRKNSGNKIMFAMILAIYLAAVTSLLYRIAMVSAELDPALIYALRIANHFTLSLLQFTYVLYMRVPLWMKNEGYGRFVVMISAVAAIPIIIDILGIIFRFGFYIEDSVIHADFTVYPFAYGAFELIIFYLIIRYRNRVIKPVFIGLMSVNLLSFFLTSVQGMYNQASFTTFAHFIPAVGLLFLFHGNPYDNETGAVNGDFFIQELGDCIEKNISLIIVRCDISDFNDQIRHSSTLRSAFKSFFKHNIKKGVLYRFSNGSLMLTIRNRKKVDAVTIIEKMIKDFKEIYEDVGLDYKFVIAGIVPEMRDPADYVKLFDLVVSEMKTNDAHWVTENDIRHFINTRYILNELEDITRKRDPDDERVVVYCQPVFNIQTGTYDTAEALMRLRLPEKGLVFPDEFIPVAEKNGFIHQLSLTILSKTCRAIKQFLAEGYQLSRVSVNFSMFDLRFEQFSEEIQDVITRVGIPYDRIAVEITESRNDEEFDRTKEKIETLQKLGIKFYLDDFGTGYSNFERIMELPFDIIKFDRSLVMESAKSETSKFMVSSFAEMFDTLHYSVLFEGIENENDEKNCRGMYAKYLQGYKYSKPIPIDDLRKFLPRDTV